MPADCPHYCERFSPHLHASCTPLACPSNSPSQHLILANRRPGPAVTFPDSPTRLSPASCQPIALYTTVMTSSCIKMWPFPGLLVPIPKASPPAHMLTQNKFLFLPNTTSPISVTLDVHICQAWGECDLQNGECQPGWILLPKI